MVFVVGFDGECADDFAGGGVNDAYVISVDEHDDGGPVEGMPDTDVVQGPWTAPSFPDSGCRSLLFRGCGHGSTPKVFVGI